MATKIRPIDYTNKDYESYRNSMINLIPVYTPEWTDFSSSDFGIVLVELLAHGLDILSFYQDRYANEAFLSTARLRRSVIDLCALIGYDLRPATPSRVVVRFTFSNPAPPGLYIPKGFQVGTQRTQTEESIIFEVEETTEVPVGATSVDVVCVQGYSMRDVVLGSGTGEPDQAFIIPSPSVIIDDSLELWVREGTSWNLWTRVEDFIFSSPTDRHYVTFVDENGITAIITGNGISGARVPEGIDNVRVNYRVGGGKIGNVGANTITSIISSGVPGLVSVTNPESPFQLGQDRETIIEAKRRAPKAFRSRQTLVTALDVEDFAENYPGVDRAKAVADEYGNYTVYIKPVDGGMPSEELKNSLLAAMDSRRILTVGISVGDPTYVTVDVYVDLNVKPNYKASMVRASVVSALEAFFADCEFGQPVHASDLYGAVMQVDGVESCYFKDSDGNPFIKVDIASNEIAVLGQIVMNLAGGA